MPMVPYAKNSIERYDTLYLAIVRLLNLLLDGIKADETLYRRRLTG